MAKHISEFLNSFISKENAWKIKLLKDWDKIIGDLKDKVAIEKIERDLLVLRVSHPAWAQELFLLSDVLKKKINSLFDKNYIRQIRFKSAALKKRKNKKNRIKNSFKSPPSNSLKDVYLTPNEKKSLSKIMDNELAEWLEKFYLCCKRGSEENEKNKNSTSNNFY